MTYEEVAFRRHWRGIWIWFHNDLQVSGAKKPSKATKENGERIGRGDYYTFKSLFSFLSIILDGTSRRMHENSSKYPPRYTLKKKPHTTGKLEYTRAASSHQQFDTSWHVDLL